MGLLDKMWDEVLGGPKPAGDHNPRSKSPPKRSLSMSNDYVYGAPSPRSSLDRSVSFGTPGSSPPSSPGDKGQWERMEYRRKSADFIAEQTQRATQHMEIPNKPTIMVDTTVAHSLPLAFTAPGPSVGSPRNLISPRLKKEENVWRSVFHPGSNKAGMDRVGSGKFDKADPNGPSVYDWYNPLTV